MSPLRSSPLPARRPQGKSGFTLVELLVVIAIIALLASVAVGPITGAMKTAKDNAGMQTTHSLYLADFQYSIDNTTNANSFADGADAGVIANALINGGYITDPTIFSQGGDASKIPQGAAGGNGNAATMQASYSSWDFLGNNAGTGIGSSDPDQLPLIWATGNTVAIPITAGETAQVNTPGKNAWGTDGIPVVYKSGSSAFRKALATTGVVGNFVDTSYTAPTTPTYAIKYGAK